MNLPQLRRSASVLPSGTPSGTIDQVAIRYLDEEITLQGAAAQLFAKIHPFMVDGKSHSVGLVAEKIDERPERLLAFTKELARTGVLAVAETDAGGDHMSGEDFYKLHHKYCEAWLREVYEHPFWERVVTGKASRAQVIGFAFEKYHYIEGAYEHMAIAAANATPEMMPHLARHFIEEFAHGDIYRKGLRSLFPDDVVLNAPPLPSTRALVNFLSECAARNSFAYYAGNELLQMTENTPEGGDDGAVSSIDSFYDAMRKHYPYTGHIIEAFIAHTRADQKLGHKDVFLEMCRSVPPLSRQQVKEAMNVVRSMAEHLLLFMDGIDVYYGNFSQMPRTSCTLLSE